MERECDPGGAEVLNAGARHAVVVIMHWDEEVPWVEDKFTWFGIWKGWWSFWTSIVAWISRVA